MVGVGVLAFIGGWVIGSQQPRGTFAQNAGREGALRPSSQESPPLNRPPALILERTPASIIPIGTASSIADSQLGVVGVELTDQGEAAAWLAEYKSLNAEQFDELAAETVKELYVASKEAFDMRFDGGMYDVLGKGNEWDGSGWDETLVMQVRQPSDLTSEIKRVVLSESEFPDYYFLKRRMLWARDRAKTLRAELAAAKKKK
jgi:hypothetical protein